MLLLSASKVNFISMKTFSKFLSTALVCAAVSAHAQMPGRPGGMGGMGMGRTPRGPDLSGSMAKIFGDNTAFTATLELQATTGAGEAMKMPGKIQALDGKSRFEIDMTQAGGRQTSAQENAQLKAMGINMDKMVMISRPDKKMSYMVMPGMQSYVENAIEDADATKSAADYKMDKTQIGKETIDGHACVKNKVVVTDKDGKAHESTVWNATDLKDFPVKIETEQGGQTSTMLFKDIKLEKPNASEFDPPTSYTKYPDMMQMIQGAVMKGMGGAQRGAPPGQ